MYLKITMNSHDFELSADMMSALNNSEKAGSILSSRSIDYTRPLKDYPTAQTIADYLKRSVKPQHVYTESLNVGGVVVQDAMEKYLENEALSSSMLKAALKTPLHFEFARSEDKEELEKIKGTPAHFNLGNFLHQAILEPTKFNRAIIEPKFSLTSHDGAALGIEFYENIITQKGYGMLASEDNSGGLVANETDAHLVFEILKERLVTAKYKSESLDYKKMYLSMLKEAADIEPVTEENYIKIQILKKHYETYGNGILKRLLHHSKREISMYHTDVNSGLKLKIRPDAIQFKENIGVDAIISIKSSGIEDLQAFYYQAAKFHYDLSEGMYQEVASKCTGRDFNTTITVMLQTVAPFAIAILVWSAEDIEMGKHKYRFALENAKEIIEKESVRGYEVFAEEDNMGLIQMSLPGWNQKEYLPVNI